MKIKRNEVLEYGSWSVGSWNIVAMAQKTHYSNNLNYE